MERHPLNFNTENYSNRLISLENLRTITYGAPVGSTLQTVTGKVSPAGGIRLICMEIEGGFQTTLMLRFSTTWQTQIPPATVITNASNALYGFDNNLSGFWCGTWKTNPGDPPFFQNLWIPYSFPNLISLNREIEFVWSILWNEVPTTDSLFLTTLNNS